MHLTQHSVALLNTGHTAEWHLCAAQRRHVQKGQRRRAHTVRGIHLQHHPVLVALREDGGHQSLTKCVVERVVNRRHRNAQATGCVSVDPDIGLQTLVLPITGDIRQGRMLTQAIKQALRPQAQLFVVGATQQKPVLGSRHPVIQGQVLQGLQIHTHATDGPRGERQSAQDLWQRGIALRFRHQIQGHASGIQRGVGPVNPDE